MDKNDIFDTSPKTPYLTYNEFKHLFNNMISPFSYYKMIYDSCGYPVDYVFIAVNRAFEKETGLDREKIIGKRVLEVYPETEKYWIESFGEVAKTGNPGHFTNYSAALNKWYDVIAYSPQPDYFAITICDISDSVKKEKTISDQAVELEKNQNAIYKLAYYNPVTKLLNKNFFRQKLQERISNDKDHLERFAIILLDLNDFKGINASFGSLFGDRLLLELSMRLSKFENCNCTVYSYGADEFLFDIIQLSDFHDVELIAKKILDDIKEPICIDNNSFFLSASCGIVFYPQHGLNIDDLLMNVNLAKFNAKDQARGSYYIYDNSIKKSLLEKIKLQHTFAKALENSEFFLCYQPQIDAKTAQVIGFEALIRWNSPEYGIVSPVSFIKIAEENRMIIPIGDWVLQSACEYIKMFNERYRASYYVSVNISVIQLIQDDFVDRVLKIIDKTGLDHRYLEFEITESVFVNSSDKIIDKINQLNSSGIKFALDDFGTGFSSLSSIKDLSISALKIDKSFIDDLLISEKDKLLTNSIILISHALNLNVVAEGVESEEQRTVLINMGCDRIQGYHISKPLQIQEIPNFIKNYNENHSN